MKPMTRKEARPIIHQIAKDLGVKVYYSKKPGFWFKAALSLKTKDFRLSIHLNRKAGGNRWVFAALHELGHASLFLKGRSSTIGLMHYNWLNVPQNDRVRMRLELDDEQAAWNEGLRLAKKYGIPIDREAWDKRSKFCLDGYREWWKLYGE